jgi:hypothetical protein
MRIFALAKVAFRKQQREPPPLRRVGRLNRVNHFELFHGLFDLPRFVIGKSKVEADPVVGWLYRQGLRVFPYGFRIETLVSKRRTQI